ncbi:hypothetical protein MMC22_006240, partial [Lobaria immixta]|nr:hypothetical protein [Lobaria immixta]
GGQHRSTLAQQRLEPPQPSIMAQCGAGVAIRKHWPVDKGGMREEGGALDEGEAVIGEVDEAIVIAREELELGHGHSGGKDLFGDLAAGDGSVGADARLYPVVAIPVRDRAVGDQDEVFFCLRDGSSPSFRLDVSLQTSYTPAASSPSVWLITIRGRDHKGQFIDVSLVRHPQDDEPLDTAKFEKRPQQVALARPVFSTRRLNIDRFAPNGSDGYLTSFGIAKTISSLAGDSPVVIEVRFGERAGISSSESQPEASEREKGFVPSPIDY